MTPRLKTQLAESPTSLPDRPRRIPRILRPVSVISVFLAYHALATAKPPSEPVPERAVTLALAAEHGLSASPSDVFWVDPTPPWWKPWSARRAWVLGGHPGALDDVFLVEARTSPEGGLLELQAIHNLTDTKATSERLLTGNGPDAAWLSGTPDALLRLTRASLQADPLAPPSGLEFTRAQRLQWRLTWLQETGQWRGVARESFKLIPPAKSAALDVAPDSVTLFTEHGQVGLPHHTAAGGKQHLSPQVHSLAKPGNWVTWSVDRLRALPWFGDENMQRLKAVVYRAWDAASRRFGLGVDAEDTRVTLVAPNQSATVSPYPSTETVPERLRRTWPPPPIAPLLTPAEADEGVWLSLKDDPFIKPSDDPNGLFFTTFLRTDPERTYSRIIITIWDPLTVQLHTMSGTEEPKSATGETGPGLVPRIKRDSAHAGDVENLVGAFNGGFQTTHGDFGMMAEGVVYVPPLPFAATVATDDAGNVGFGTWPEQAPVPKTLVGLRQNLTPLVAGGVFNPYGRTWWGGVPSGWEDDTRTVRSGLCLTKSGLVAYFYGAKVDAENLAKAMQTTDCDYGLHLDMNQGHTGLEFYHVAPQTDLPPFALTLDRVWQAEGVVPEAPELAFRGRRMFRAMQLMNFPRYVQRETRDFFYLTRREMLPRRGREATWTVPPSVQRIYPFALAVRSATPSDAPGALVQLLELAPEFVEPKLTATGDLVVASLRQPSAQSPAVYWTDGRLTLTDRAPETRSVALLPTTAPTESATALVCIRPSTGSLLFAEVASSSDATRNQALLTAALLAEGCNLADVRETTSGAFEIDGRDLNGHPGESVHPRLALSYRRPSRHFSLFPDTPVVAPTHWKPLQTKPE